MTRHGTALRGAEPCLAASSPVNTKVLQMKNSHIFGAKIQKGLLEMTLVIFKHCVRRGKNLKQKSLTNGRGKKRRTKKSRKGNLEKLWRLRSASPDDRRLSQ